MIRDYRQLRNQTSNLCVHLLKNVELIKSDKFKADFDCNFEENPKTKRKHKKYSSKELSIKYDKILKKKFLITIFKELDLRSLEILELIMR